MAKKDVIVPDETLEVKAPEAKAPEIRLVEMTRDGERIEVHPSCVAAHQAAGWTMVGSREELAAAQSLAEQARAAAAPGGLVEMVQDGVRIEVHSSAVKAHQTVGWKLA